MRKSTPTWRHFRRPASISCAMNRCEAFKNLAASIVEKSSFRTDETDADISAGLIGIADGAGNGGDGDGTGAGTGA